jgi:hypothetical protein
MAQKCVEISLSSLNFTGMDALLGIIGSFKIPSMPIVPDPLMGDQSYPLMEKMEKLGSIVMSAIMKYFKEFILDPINIIISQVKVFIAAAGDLWDEIINFEIPHLGVKFMDFIDDLIARGGVAISELVDKIKNIVDSIKPIQLPDPLIATGKNPIWEAIQKVQAAIKEASLIVFKKCMDIMDLVINKVKLAMDIAGVSLGPMIDAFFTMLTNVGELISKGWTALMAMFGLGDIDSSGILKSLSDKVASAVGEAKRIAAEQLKAAMQVVQDMKVKIIEFMAKLTVLFDTIPIPGLPDFATILGGKAVDFYKQFTMYISNWWTSMTSAIMNVFTEAMKEFKTSVEQMLAIINALGQQAKNDMVNMINQVTGGMMSFITGLPAMLAGLTTGKITYCIDVEEPTLPAT